MENDAVKEKSRDERILEILTGAFESGNVDALPGQVREFRPADVARVLVPFSPEQKSDLMKALPDEYAARVLEEAAERDRNAIVGELPAKELREILPDMSPDEAVDVLQKLDPAAAHELISSLPEARRQEVKDLYGHGDDTAGGIMTSDYLAMRPDTTVASAEREIRENREVDQNITNIYVVDAQDRLEGVVTLKKLITSADSDKLGDLAILKPIRVRVDTDQEQVARLARQYNLTTVPVVDTHDRLVGVVTSDDIMDVFEEEHTEDLHVMSGVLGEGVADDTDSVFGLVKLRLPWLCITLLGQLVSGYILHSFEVEMNKVIALVFFVPVVMALSGNVGIQAAILVGRGMLNAPLPMKRFASIILRELQVAAWMGIVLSSLIALAAFGLIDAASPLMLAASVGVSCLAAVLLANLVGTFLPVLFVKFRIDPAVASGPIVTTTNDILGLLVYFSVASVLLDL